MSEDRLTFSEIGEENVRQHLRWHCDERVLYGRQWVQPGTDDAEEN